MNRLTKEHVYWMIGLTIVMFGGSICIWITQHYEPAGSPGKDMEILLTVPTTDGEEVLRRLLVAGLQMKSVRFHPRHKGVDARLQTSHGWYWLRADDLEWDRNRPLLMTFIYDEKMDHVRRKECTSCYTLPNETFGLLKEGPTRMSHSLPLKGDIASVEVSSKAGSINVVWTYTFQKYRASGRSGGDEDSIINVEFSP